jgi:hypothetical protein
MTYASTARTDRTIITISRADRSQPDMFQAENGEHQITIEPTGVLRVDLYGQTLLYAPGTWTRVAAAAIEDQPAVTS